MHTTNLLYMGMVVLYIFGCLWCNLCKIIIVLLTEYHFNCKKIVAALLLSFWILTSIHNSFLLKQKKETLPLCLLSDSSPTSLTIPPPVCSSLLFSMIPSLAPCIFSFSIYLIRKFTWLYSSSTSSVCFFSILLLDPLRWQSSDSKASQFKDSGIILKQHK